MDARWSELWSVERRAATATVALGVVLFAFNAFVVSTALPRAVAEFGGTRWLAWATSLYIICSIVTGPAAALVMHRVGAKAMFMAAGGVFLAGTLLAAAAPSMVWLLVGRAMQGAAAGCIESGCYVLIPRLFPPRLISRVFGIEAVAWAVAAFAAPALAGVLAAAFSWRVALLASVPMVLIFLALVPRVVGGRGERTGEVPRLPLWSLLGVAGGMGLIVLSDSSGALALQLIYVAAGLGLFVAVIRSDGRRGGRLVPHGAFSLRRRLGLGLWVALLMPMSQSVEAVFLVYVLQFLWEFTPLQAGLSPTVLALSWSAAQMLTAQIRGERGWLVAAGAGLLVLGQAMMFAAFWGHSVALMLAAQLVLGAAFGTAWGALSQVVMESAGADRDQASGLLPVVFSAGFGIGAALIGPVANGLGFATAKGADLQGVMLWLIVAAGGLAVVAAMMALGLARRGTQAGVHQA